MKKNLKIIILFLFFFNMKNTYAATASGNISLSTSSTIIGNSGTATLTITADSPIAQIYGTFSCGNLGSKDLTYVLSDNNPSKSRSYTIDWKASAIGTYTCQVNGLEVGVLDGSSEGAWPTISVAQKNIQVIGNTPSAPQKPGSNNNGSNKGGTNSGGTIADKKEYSSDNTLSSLTIDNQNLTPEFNKDITEYKLSLDESIEKINVNAKPTSDKASITGGGEVSLSPGENTIEIKVTAENGNEKIYKIIVTVEDQNPISVKIGQDTYTVVKKNNNLLSPLENYNETTIKINDQDVVAYTNPKAKITLVLLKNKDNKVAYYIYNKQTKKYEEYHTITVGNTTLQLLKSPITNNKYIESSITLQQQKITFYKIKESHKTGLIYGTNVKTGNTSFYVYDPEEETLSKYYDEEVKFYQEELKNMKNYLMIFIGIVAFITIIIIIMSLIKSKKKKKHKNYIK